MTEVMREAILKHCKKHKYSKEYIDFWIHHPFCSICGNYSAAPHHIRTRGAGGGDEVENLLALCTMHHTESHTMGMLTFAAKYQQFHDKVYEALDVELEPDALNIFVGQRW